jgi:AcrR family transcriptional regulator
MVRKHTTRDRRLEIQKIAGPLFLKDGYEGTSMSQIASAVGGSKATLYSYFSSKEKLFEAYMEMRVHQEAADVFEFPETADTMRSALTRFGLKFLEMTAGEDSRTLMRLLYHEAPRFPEIGRIFYDLCLSSGRKRLTEYLIRAAAEGMLRVPDPVLAAEQFISLCQAKIVMELMLCVQQEISPNEAEEIVKAAVSTFLAAYAA